MGVVFSVIGLIQYFSGSLLIYGIRPIGRYHNPFGPYYNMGQAACLMGMCFCVGMGILLSTFQKGWRAPGEGGPADAWALRFLVGGGLGLLAAGVWFTHSRSALVAILIGLGATLGLAISSFSFGRGRARLLAVLIGATILSLGLLALAGPLGRTAWSPDVSLDWRGSMWRSGIQMIFDRPLTGSGWGAVRYAFPVYQGSEITGTVEHIHSDWMEILCEGGLIGFSIYGAAVLFTFFRSIKSWRRGMNPVSRCLKAGALSAAAVFMIYGITDFHLPTPASAALFFFILATMSARVDRKIPYSGVPGGGDFFRRRLAGWALVGVIFSLTTFGIISAIRFGRASWHAMKSEKMGLSEKVVRLEKALSLDPLNPHYARSLGAAYLWLAREHTAARRIFSERALIAVEKGLAGTPLFPDMNDVEEYALNNLDRPEDAQEIHARTHLLRPWRLSVP